MKKVLLGLLCLLALPIGMNAQKVIEDFELITLRQLSNDAYPDDSMVVVANPAPSSVDSSTSAMRFRRSKDGAVWCGFWSQLPSPYDMTNYKYVSVHVMKPRLSTVKFKVEGGSTNPAFFELPSITEPSKVNEWEKLVYHFPDATGTYTKIAMLLDFVDPVGLTEDITIYVDDITLRTQPVGGDSIVLEDFQVIPLNQLSNSTLPNDSLVVVTNPAKDAGNMSDKVLKFRRSSAGDIWAGFWSRLPEKIDMTNNKYILVKVWKPRVSTIKFKVEGGTSSPNFFELESTAPQTKTNEWEQMVFHFPDATGEYPTIAMLPDFSDPVGLDEDIVLYIDDIVLSPTETGIPSGVVDPKEREEIGIYPNPVKSTLNFENLKDVDRITISNIVGQQVMVTRNIRNEKVSINVSSLTNGIYMVSVVDKNGNTTVRKVVKE
jgi:hypothetical protein